MFPFDESLIAGKQVSLLNFSDILERWHNSVSQMSKLNILRLWIPHNEGFFNIGKDTAL